MSGPPSPMSDFGFIQLRPAAVYEYEPLPGINYIRRVKIHPGNLEDAILISLDVVTFSGDEKPEYEALLYVWGSPEQPEVVRVDEKYGLTISATRKLIMALRYLRSTDEPRILWVDALCINQQDEVEKGPQVAMMGDIYRHATRVVAWIVPDAGNSDAIMAKMESLGSLIQVDFAGKVTFSLAEGATDLDLDLAARSIYLPMEEIDALVQLLHRPWFSRLWIRQEVQLASSAAVITCGHSQVPWPVFLQAFVLILHRRVEANENRGPIIEPAVIDRVRLVQFQLVETRMALIGFTSAGSKTVSLCDLRQNFESSDCYDPRDRIYGIMSSLPDDIREGIVPDYTKPFGDVYKDAFLHYTQRQRSGDLCLLGSCELETGSHIPSWVPDWSRKSKCGTIINGQRASSQLASWHELQNNLLRVAGVLVGTIQYHDGFRVQHSWIYDVYKLYEELRRLLINLVHPERTITDEEKIEYVARTLVCNLFAEKFELPDERHPTIESGKSIVLKMLSDVDRDNPGIFAEDEIRFLSMAIYMTGKQIFRTTDGQFGVAPPQARSDDQICVVLGCDAPMILRATQNGKLLVVGSCFMQKVNDGESLLGPLPDHTKLRESQEVFMPVWKDSRTGLLSYVDPRLKSFDIFFDVPEIRVSFKCNVHPEFLRKEDVPIKYFDLV